MLETAGAEIKTEIEALEKEKGEIKTAMEELKTKLYSKFGNSINLEED